MGPSASRPVRGLWVSLSSPSGALSAALLSPADSKPGPAHRVAAGCCTRLFPAQLTPPFSYFAEQLYLIISIQQFLLFFQKVMVPSS